MNDTRGVVCSNGSLTADALDDWCGDAAGVRYTTDSVAITADPRECHFASGTVAAEGEQLQCWLLGDVYGYDATEAGQSGGYESRPADVDPAQYCLSLYERDGRSFARGLNGNFTVIVHDRERQQVTFCTDRFGTVPVYWARPDDDTLVFSTNVQLVALHPSLDPSFDEGYLHEYLAFRRSCGVKTPLEGVEMLEPGTLTTVSLASGETSTDQYWRPRYRPRDESFEWFVEEFTRRFRTVLEEWTREGNDYGVLLSGGSDSRLALAGLEDATAFHMNDWMNREARVAERAALEADADFELLERGPEYRIDAIERNRWATAYTGWFSHPYTSGFEDEITDEVDGLVSGLYGDSLFEGFGVPSPTVSVEPLGSVTLPVERSIETVDDYVDLLLEEAHDGVEMPTDLRSVLEANIYRDGDRIVHHGVTYDSLDELVYYGNCYPLSNDDDLRFYTTLRRTLPSRSPFLDNRLVDLSLSLPVRYRLRRNLVGRALERLDPELAAIPHANTGVAPSRSFATSYVAKHLHEFWRKHVSRQTPPEPYLTDGPWLDDAELLRSHEFAIEVIERNGDLADAMPGPDEGDIHELYRNHCAGENYVGELYTLLTLLTMPATAHVLGEESVAPDDHRRAKSCRLERPDGPIRSHTGERR